ncbi:MAG: ribonuclease E/G [Eubacteriales bacterium]
MKRVILNGPDFCAVTEDGRLTEYIPRDPKEQSGDILLGRIDRMMPGMNCAFVDIGRRKNGFMPLEESGKTFLEGRPKSGETLILQVRREETGEKGAFLTRDITLAGTCVILMPKNRYIGVSSRIAEEEERERLKQLGREIAGDRFGLVLRHSSVTTMESEIRNEAEALWSEWKKIASKASESSQPGTVLRANGVLDSLKNDYSGRGIDEIRDADELPPDLKRQLAAAEGRTVRLAHGGNIVIDRCEAMTVIDVNTASAVSSGDKERTILETNLEACEEIVIQVRVRDLAGIIVIDFIDMETETDQSLVCNRLKECFENDRIKTVIHGWTQLGLMEMTRKRR